jgi:hypothetical protein
MGASGEAPDSYLARTMHPGLGPGTSIPTYPRVSAYIPPHLADSTRSYPRLTTSKTHCVAGPAGSRDGRFCMAETAGTAARTIQPPTGPPACASSTSPTVPSTPSTSMRTQGLHRQLGATTGVSQNPLAPALRRFTMTRDTITMDCS